MATFKVSVSLFVKAGWFFPPFCCRMIHARSYCLHLNGLCKNIGTVRIVAFAKVQNCILEVPRFQFRAGCQLSYLTFVAVFFRDNALKRTANDFLPHPNYHPRLKPRPPSQGSAIRRYTNISGFLGHYFLAMKTLFVDDSCVPKTNSTDLIFSVIFVWPLPPRNSSR
jgi:hypothetical protein